ncbi:MAG: hypothetical protein H7329_00610 [Opitutaceae bacterium]|nr:hypothetical protein [Cytophagales bacterium]
MKNKNVTYFLGISVLVVWGLIFFRFFNSESDEDLSPIQTNNHYTKIDKNEKDTFELILNYRDPFLGQLAEIRNNSDANRKNDGKIKKLKTTKPKVVIAPIDWSFVSYLGTIYGKQSKKKLAILRINESEKMVGNNDKIGDLVILKVGKDSVLVSFLGNRKVLR